MSVATINETGARSDNSWLTTPSMIHTGRSDRFDDAINEMRLNIWRKFLAGVANNPRMSKKEVCDYLGLKIGTINSIQQNYKLQSPYYYSRSKSKKGNAASITSTKTDKKRHKAEVKGGALS